MGARGHLGGLSLAAREAIRLLGAFGFDPVILETVGVGQSELEVAAVADTTVVVLTPNLGDGVQMIKAGILEIADIFVVNKADLEGHQRVATELRSMLSLAPKSQDKAWKQPIVATSATRQEGIEELWAAIESHRKHREAGGKAKAQEVNLLLAPLVDVMLGNEEDFTAALGFTFGCAADRTFRRIRG